MILWAPSLSSPEKQRQIEKLSQIRGDWEGMALNAMWYPALEGTGGQKEDINGKIGNYPVWSLLNSNIPTQVSWFWQMYYGNVRY